MLNQRSFEKEQMDNLSLKGLKLERTLDGLSVINRLLGNTNGTLNAIKTILKDNNEILTIVDLGCGGGDNLREISNWCTKNNRKIKLIGIDGNSNILDLANSKVGGSIEYIQADILNKNFVLPECDILISSHFMYHFNDDDLVYFLNNCKSKVRKGIVFSELSRNSFAYILFKYLGFLLPLSPIVKQDGLLAIRRSFRKNELNTIVNKSVFNNYTIRYKWAFRYLLTINVN